MTDKQKEIGAIDSSDDVTRVHNMQPGEATEFRNFKKQQRHTAGESGLWKILDSVASQPTLYEYIDQADEVQDDDRWQVIPAQPSIDSSTDASFHAAEPPFNASEPSPYAPEPPPYAPEPPRAPEPPPYTAHGNTEPYRPVASPPQDKPPPAPSTGQGQFGHLFRKDKPRPDAPVEEEKSPSLKALFRRISS